jgi:predicted nuclease of predicted toxin-antitoxin system
MRFYLDAHMPREATPLYLRRKGHSSRHAVRLGFADRDDDFHYQYAKSVKCILITRDEDFADSRRVPYHKHPGAIIIAAGRSASAADVIELLGKVLRLSHTTASLYESKVIAHADYCIHLTGQNEKQIAYL